MATDHIELFEFGPAATGPGHLGRWFIEGDARSVEQYIPRRELFNLMGGYHLSPRIDPDDPSQFCEYIGIHGKRRVARFKRLLRERGAGVVVRTDLTWAERETATREGGRVLGAIADKNYKGLWKRSKLKWRPN